MMLTRHEWNRHELWSECYRVARIEGLAPGLRLLSATVGEDVLPCGPGGHALVPADVARSARRIWLNGAIVDRVPGKETLIEQNLLDQAGFVALRYDTQTTAFADDPREWIAGLAWLRLGLSEQLLHDSLARLGDRTTGAGPLLDQQVVKGELSDALIEQIEVKAVLADAAGAHLTMGRLRHLHRQITTADRMLLRLLGASGVAADEPGRLAYISELLADAYVAASTEEKPT